MKNVFPKAAVPTSLMAAVTLISGVAQAAPGYKDGAELPTSYAQTIYAHNNGVIANDGLDDAAAIQAIIDGISLNNSPNNLIRILLPAGEITLNDEVHVDRSGVVIEGRGTAASSGTHVVVNSWQPYGIASDGAPDFDKKYWPGFGAFRAETRVMHEGDQNYEGSINFHWKHGIEFGSPVTIGDTTLKLENGGANNFSVGDLIYVGAASDKTFMDKAHIPEELRSKSTVNTGHMRTQIFHVTAVDTSANTVSIDKPMEFNVELLGEEGYKSRVMPVTAVQNVGFRNFTLRMDNANTDCASNNADNWSLSNPMGVGHRYENVCARDAIHGLIFKYADDSFVDNVEVNMMGSHPIVTEFAKNMTFDGVKIDGSWNKGAGGNGYFRGSKLFDSIIKNSTIENVRHLTLQWSSTGNIVEDNNLNVDMNLHGGWERNNLIRNNTIEIPFEHRSWSNGAPGDGGWLPIWYGTADHATDWSGPTGPNNVFINNTLKKAHNDGDAITRWGLFDTPNVAYAFAWDGENFVHLNDNGTDITRWKKETAEAVYAQMPNSGVTIDGDSDPIVPTDPVDPVEPAAPVEFSTSVTSPANNATITLGDTVTLTASAVSTEASITKVNFKIDGSYYKQDASAPYATDWTPTAAGTYSITTRVYNANGEQKESTARTVTVVEPAPEAPAELSVSVTAPAANATFELGQTISLKADAASPDSSITKVNFKINGGYYKQDSTADYQVSWTPTEAGTYTITAKAFDADGSTVETAGRTVTIVAAGTPAAPAEPEAPVSGSCSTTINVDWNTKTEVTLQAGACIKFSQNLSGKTVQAWDSDANGSCDFRGTLASVDGNGSQAITSNYYSGSPFTGTTLQVQSGYSCNYVQLRAY